MNRIFPQPTDYLAPITESEQILIDKWKANELTNQQKNQIKLRICIYSFASTVIFGVAGVYLVNSLIKDFETQSMKKMEKELQSITDKMKRADFQYSRTTEISNMMLKISKYKSFVSGACYFMGMAYGLAQARLFLRDESEKIVTQNK